MPFNPMVGTLLSLATSNPAALAEMAASAGISPPPVKPEPPAAEAAVTPAGDPALEARMRQAFSGIGAVQAPAVPVAPVQRPPFAQVPRVGQPRETNLAVIANLLAPQRGGPPPVGPLAAFLGR